MRKLFLAGAALMTMASLASVAAPTFAQTHAVAHHVVKHTAKAVTKQNIALTILPGSHLGPDKKLHDSFTQADFNVVAGVPVTVTVYNYDSGNHSFTSSSLHMNVTLKGSAKTGVPGVTTFKFTPKAGNYGWECVLPCDGQNKAWAMSHDGYMKGTVHALANKDQQFVYLTVKDGLQFAAADKKIHDSFEPANFTVQAGIPVHVTVVNYDSGEHSLTSPALGLNKVFPGAAKKGAPGVTSFTFTPQKPGSYHWRCMIPCDGGPTGWAMFHNGYMSGTITVVK